ncbi:MAG: hypothetical protein HY396_00865 [Candidatus Doudnabacteria bacterium]|nr:hypothetical protein [Candidatus Doudnabacteria bacterium]
MKYYELDKNEKRLLKDFEKASLLRISSFRQKRKKYEQYAQATLAKTRNINLRIPEKDLLKIKARAAEKGIPYQTLLASLVHQYSNGQIRDKV